VSAQAKPISEVVKDFEQSLESLRPSTRRVYLAGARLAIRAANLELWQCPSATELLASLGESPTEKKTRISPFLNFLGGGELKELVSDENSTALQNWVIQRLAKETRSVKNPSIATRRAGSRDRMTRMFSKPAISVNSRSTSAMGFGIEPAFNET